MNYITRPFIYILTAVFIFGVTLTPCSSASAAETSDAHSLTPAGSLLHSFVLAEEAKQLYKERKYLEAYNKSSEALSIYPNNSKAKKYMTMSGKRLKSDIQNEKQDSTAKHGFFSLFSKRSAGSADKTSSRDNQNKISASADSPVAVTEPTVLPPAEEALTPDKNTEPETMPDEPDNKALKVQHAEELVAKGNIYYEKNEYLKAFELYKQAIEALE